MNPYTNVSTLTVAYAQPSARAVFIRRTYAHLAGAIAAFIAIEAILLRTALPQLMLTFIQGSPFGWLMILGAFILAGWLARGLASSPTSVRTQYIGLGAYVLAEAVIFVPILYLAAFYSSPKGSKHESSNDLIPADVCVPKLRSNSAQPLSSIKTCHYQAQLIETCTLLL